MADLPAREISLDAFAHLVEDDLWTPAFSAAKRAFESHWPVTDRPLSLATRLPIVSSIHTRSICVSKVV